MSTSMKFIRWILSHLTVIVVLSLILYFYWNRSEFWPDNTLQTVPVTVDQLSGRQEIQAQNQEATATEQVQETAQNIIDSQSSGHEEQGIQAVEAPKYPSEMALSSSDDLLEPALKNEKSFEKHAIIEVRTEKTLLYPSDIENEIAKEMAPAEAYEPLAETLVENGEIDSQSVVNSDGWPEILEVDQQVSLLKGDDAIEPEIIISQNGPVSDNLEQATDLLNEPSERSESASYTDKTIQQQIKDRQKQLSNQMLSLITLTMNKTVEYEPVKTVSNVQPIEPVIETAEQRSLLQDARKAFDEHQFKLAEEKYLQLMQQLPELPDVVGELANVYRSQNRQLDYIAMNTQFVKRLTEHYRFDEAWRVVSETSKVDQQSANKQRRIIYKKQRESQN